VGNGVPTGHTKHNTEQNQANGNENCYQQLFYLEECFSSYLFLLAFIRLGFRNPQGIEESTRRENEVDLINSFDLKAVSMKTLLWIFVLGFVGAGNELATAQDIIKPYRFQEFEAQVHKVKVPNNEEKLATVTVNVGNMYITYFIDRYSPYLSNLIAAAEKPPRDVQKPAFLFNTEIRAPGGEWIKSVRPLPRREISEAQKAASNAEFEQLLTTRYSYVPTLTREQDLQSHYNSMEDFLHKQKLKDCFRRAHLWSHSLETNYGVKGFKVFIFYTRSMTAPIDKDWWYHVAPMYRVEKTLPSGEKTVQEMVLDPQFPGDLGKSAVTVDRWVENFSKKTPCRYTNDFYDFFNHQFSAQCYVMKVPMYYYGPADLELIRLRDKLERPHPRQDLRFNSWNFEDLVKAREEVKVKWNWKPEEEE
jgi:hypothetical protein